MYEATNVANVNTLPAWRELDTATDAVADLRALIWQSTYQADEPGRSAAYKEIESRPPVVVDALKKYESGLLPVPWTPT